MNPYIYSYDLFFLFKARLSIQTVHTNERTRLLMRGFCMHSQMLCANMCCERLTLYNNFCCSKAGYNMVWLNTPRDRRMRYLNKTKRKKCLQWCVIAVGWDNTCSPALPLSQVCPRSPCTKSFKHRCNSNTCAHSEMLDLFQLSLVVFITALISQTLVKTWCRVLFIFSWYILYCKLCAFSWPASDTVSCIRGSRKFLYLSQLL